MRQYEKEVVRYDRRLGRYRETTYLNPGVKQVHIGDDVWLCGRVNLINKCLKHLIIYAPDRKTEHHVFGFTVEGLIDNEYLGVDHAKLKIYILTSILDDVRNWCFDLKKIPNDGNLKVICKNGTVKNILFKGAFVPIKRQKKTFLNPLIPVGYRIK